MSNFRKFVSMSAVAILGVTNLLTPLSYASAASDYDSLNIGSQWRSFSFLMPDHHVTLYAVTEANHYFVRYNAPDKTSWTMSESEHVYDQSKNLTKNDYKKTWYTFSGWNTSSSGDGTGYADEQSVINLTGTESGHVDIYARWNANKYNISYTLNSWTHGTEHPETATYDTQFEVSTPSRAWYTFSGWDISGMDSTSHTVGWASSTATSATGVMGTQFNNLTSTSGATVNFAAKWNAASSKYHVHHELQNIDNDLYTRKTEDSQELTWFTDEEVSPKPKTYEWFTKPLAQSGTITADGNLEIVYQYDRQSFDLTLIPGRWIASVSADGSRNHINSATTQTTQQFKYGESIELSLQEKPWYEGGQWNGGASQFSMPASDQTRTAVATPITYTITYNTKWGTVSQANPDNYNVESSKITLNNPTRSHSQFLWWTGTDLASGTIKVEIPTGSIWNRSYTAVWTCDTWYNLTGNATSCEASTGTIYTVNHYKADLNWNYNSVFETTTQSGSTDDYTNATANTYAWFEVDGNIENKLINWNGTTVVNIYYKRSEYTLTVTNTQGVTVTANGAHPGTNWKYKYGDTVTVTASTWDGYNFTSWTVTNWNTSVVNAVAPSTTFTMPAENVTIKANVTPIEYTITYNLNGWSATNPTTYTIETNTFTLNDPTRPHSQFAWWTWVNVTSWTSVTISKWSVWNRSYEAMWTCDPWYHDVNGVKCDPNEYNVVVVNGDGTHGLADPVTFTYDERQTLPNPEQPWYNFIWWDITWMSGWVEHKIGTISVTENTYTYNAEGGTGTSILNLTTDEQSTVTFTARWQARTDTDYVVYHFYKKLWEDSYELIDTENLEWQTDSSIVLESKAHSNVTWFTYSAWYLTGGTTRPTSGATESTTINKSGTTEIYLYYNRNKFNVTLSGDSKINSLSRTWPREFEYGATVEVSATPKTWYHFKQWRE